ncbi:hypothetical protein [Microbacterium esteraromaticum]|nr:hypothetical protein [Microbacterium esteraromaticum]MBM7464579.1 hypothetical protein [Microbacterium esteraromaticum]
MSVRKDGRSLVTEPSVTAYDRIDFIAADELELPQGGIACILGEPFTDST